jgi:CBS domain-containing protein
MSVSLRDAMTSPPVLLDCQATVLDAAKLMAEKDVGAVGVTDHGELSSVVTDRDIVVRGIACGIDVGSARVTEVASDNAVTVEADSSVEEAERRMVERRVRRLFVVDGDDIIGVISNDDVAAIHDERSVQAKQLEESEHTLRRDFQGHTGQGE